MLCVLSKDVLFYVVYKGCITCCLLMLLFGGFIDNL